MKKFCMLLCMLVAVVVCFLPMTVTQASDISCWHNDLNYPRIDSGSGGYSVIDVSSAYIYQENHESITLRVMSYSVMSKKPNELQYGREIAFRYYKKSGQVLVADDKYAGNFTKPILQKLVNDAYRLMCRHLGLSEPMNLHDDIRSVHN